MDTSAAHQSLYAKLSSPPALADYARALQNAIVKQEGEGDREQKSKLAVLCFLLDLVHALHASELEGESGEQYWTDWSAYVGEMVSTALCCCCWPWP